MELRDQVACAVLGAMIGPMIGPIIHETGARMSNVGRVNETGFKAAVNENVANLCRFAYVVADEMLRAREVR